MSHKTGKDNQLWRLEDSGCLRSKQHEDRCLGLETHTTGGGVYLQEDEGIPSQQWWFVQQVRTTLHLKLDHSVSNYHCHCIASGKSRLWVPCQSGKWIKRDIKITGDNADMSGRE